MKVARSVLLPLAVVSVAALAFASAAFAEDHGCCAKPTTAAPAKSEAAQKSDADVIAQQKPTYPLDTCVVLGNKLGAMGAAVDYVYKGRLVRFCCNGCIATFEKEPQKYLSKLDAAAKTKAPQATAKPAAGTQDAGMQHKH